MRLQIIKLLAALAVVLLALPVQAATLAGLRSRVNHYLGDSTNTMVPAYIKDSIINVSQYEYAESFPVYIDTTRQGLTVGTRMYALPSNYAGRIVSVHKDDANFTIIRYAPTDSTISTGTTPRYYSVQEATIVVYPRPTTIDTIFIFYAAYPDYLDTLDTESGLRDGLEEPLVLLAASKCWAMKEYRIDLADWFFNKYVQEASRLMRLEQEMPQR